VIIKRSIFSLTVVLSLYLTVNIAIAGSTISGKVTCKRVKDPRDTIVYVEKVEGKFEPPAEHIVCSPRLASIGRYFSKIP
jgi:hypothetical protein